MESIAHANHDNIAPHTRWELIFSNLSPRLVHRFQIRLLGRAYIQPIQPFFAHNALTTTSLPPGPLSASSQKLSTKKLAVLLLVRHPLEPYTYIPTGPAAYPVPRTPFHSTWKAMDQHWVHAGPPLSHPGTLSSASMGLELE